MCSAANYHELLLLRVCEYRSPSQPLPSPACVRHARLLRNYDCSRIVFGNRITAWQQIHSILSCGNSLTCQYAEPLGCGIHSMHLAHCNSTLQISISTFMPSPLCLPLLAVAALANFFRHSVFAGFQIAAETFTFVPVPSVNQNNASIAVRIFGCQ